MVRSLNSILFIVFFFQIAASAQPDEIDPAEVNSSVQSDFYYLLYRENVNIDIVKGALVTTTTTNKIFYYNDYKNTGYSSFDIVYNSGFSEIKNLEVASYVPEKGKYRKYPVKDFTTSFYSESTMFEDAYKEITFTMPAVNKGTIGQIRYDDVNKEPHFSSVFYFKQFVPIARNEFIVTIDKRVDIAYKYIGDSSGISFEKTIKGDKITYKWSARNLETFKREDYMPKLGKITTQVVCWVKSADINGKNVLINKDLSSFSSWIYGLCKNVFSSPLSEDAKHFVDSLKQQNLSETMLGKKIFTHVQKNIKYIAFENGLHGYIPRLPADVYYKRYGDCKDKATLLAAMLNYAGIEARTALVGTTDLIYKFSELPIPECANHMITAVKVNGAWTITDATDEYVSYLSVPQALQGKEALILLDSSGYLIYRAPEVPYYSNGRIDSLTVTLNGMDITGSGKTLLTGYLKQNVEAATATLNAERMKEFYKEFLALGNNKCEYSGVVMQANSDTSLLITYSFRLPSYVTQFEGKYYFNPHLLKAEIDDYGIDNSKMHPVNFKFASFSRLVLNINLSGFSLDHTPRNAAYKHERFGFSVSYRNEGSSVLISSDYYENMMQLEKRDFSEYESYFTALRRSNLDNISFIKK